MKKLLMIFIGLIFTVQILSQWSRTKGPEGISMEALKTIGDTTYAGTATDGLFASTDDGNTWFTLNTGIETTEIRAINTVNGFLFAGSDNGIYRSSDWGITWQLLPNSGNVYVEDLVVNDEYIFAGTINNGVIKSSDNGENWEDAGFYFDYCTGLCIQGNKLFATEGHYSMYTTDNGDNWNYVDDLLGGSLFSLYSTDFLVLAGGRGSIFRSTDNGNTFLEVDLNFDFSIVNMYDFTTVGTTIYVATSYDGVYKSTDNGLTWESANTGMGPKDVRTLTVTGSSTLLAGSHYSGLYRSIDQAENWDKSMEGFPAGSSILTMVNSEFGVYAGTRDGIYHSTDNGFSWNKLTGVSDTINYSDIRGICVDSRDIYAACTYHFHATIYKSTDYGETWKRSDNGIPSDAVFLWDIAKSGQNIIAATDQGVYYSSDKGQSWQPTNTIGQSIQHLAVTDDYVFGARILNDVYRSADDGVNWNVVLNSPSAYFTALTARDNFVYAGGFDFGSFYSTNSGNVWYVAGFPTGTSVYTISFIPAVSGMVLAGTDQEPNYIYAAYNNSPVFSSYSEGLGENAITEAITSNDTYMFAGTDYNGVWRRLLPGVTPVELASFIAKTNKQNVKLEWETESETNNKGFEIQKKKSGDRSQNSEWEKVGFVNGSGTTTEYQNYSYVDENVASGKYFYRLKQINFDGSFEYSETINVEVGIPDEFSLEQNYPNPFNPDTKIRFNLPVESNVTIIVFNVLGQKIKTLVNRKISAGNHDVNFNAANLNSGVYLYRINAEGKNGKNFTSVKKMILAK